MNMLLGAASTGQAEQHKPGIIQYQYATNVNAAVHPMNLATTTSSAGKQPDRVVEEECGTLCFSWFQVTFEWAFETKLECF